MDYFGKRMYMLDLPYEKFDHKKYCYRLVRSVTITLPEQLIKGLQSGRWWTVDRRKNTLTAHRGYAWNGASGVLFQTKNLAIPSLFHDVLYQALAEGKLPATYDMRYLSDVVYSELLKRENAHLFRSIKPAFKRGVRSMAGALRRWVHYAVLRVVGWRAAKMKPWQ